MSLYDYLQAVGILSAPAPSPAGAEKKADGGESKLNLVRGLDAMPSEAFRTQIMGTLERRLFFTPSFKIYGGVAGLYDYGPPGCALKSNLLALWRQHFVMEVRRGRACASATHAASRGRRRGAASVGSLCLLLSRRARGPAAVGRRRFPGPWEQPASCQHPSPPF